MPDLSSPHSRPASSRLVPLRGRAWTHGAVLVGYAILTLVMTWPLAMQFTTAIPGDAFDGWQNYWNLWWIKVALVERLQNPYFTDLLYFPTGVSLYFHTLNPFNGLVTLPVQLVAGLIPAYNTVVLISWVLAGYGTWLLARWMIVCALRNCHGRGDTHAGDVAAFVAGAVFAFAPVHMAHLLGHMQVMALQWLPLYVLALLRAMAQARRGQSWRRAALLAGLFLALAGLCDWYFVLYLFLFTLLVLVAAWGRLLLRGARGWRAWGASVAPAVVAGVVFALALAPLLLPMIYEATRFTFMVRPSTDLYTFSATGLDFVLPNRLHTLLRPDSLAAWGNQIAPLSERTVAIGYTALALALLALFRVRRRAAWWGVAALLFALLALGPRMHLWRIVWDDIPAAAAGVQEWSPYAVVNAIVPFMRISRSVSRFAIMVQLAVAVLAGMGLAWWLGRVHTASIGWWGAVVLALVLAEYWVVPYPMSPPDTPAYYAALAQIPGQGALLNLPMNYDRPGYLLYQTVHQRPLTVAYISRDDPRTLTERVPLLQHWRHLGPDILALDPAHVGMTVLVDLGVETVVLDRYKMPGGEEREYTEALARALFAASAPTYEDERLTVYTVTPPDVPQPYLALGPLGWGPLEYSAGVQYRMIADERATLHLHHIPPGTHLTIDYASDSETVVSGDDGSQWTMPAAPGGHTFTIELPSGLEQVTLLPQGGELRVTRAGLVLPAPD